MYEQKNSLIFKELKYLFLSTKYGETSVRRPQQGPCVFHELFTYTISYLRFHYVKFFKYVIKFSIISTLSYRRSVTYYFFLFRYQNVVVSSICESGVIEPHGVSDGLK